MRWGYDRNCNQENEIFKNVRLAAFSRMWIFIFVRRKYEYVLSEKTSTNSIKLERNIDLDKHHWQSFIIVNIGNENVTAFLIFYQSARNGTSV